MDRRSTASPFKGPPGMGKKWRMGHLIGNALRSRSAKWKSTDVVNTSNKAAGRTAAARHAETYSASRVYGRRAGRDNNHPARVLAYDPKRLTRPSATAARRYPQAGFDDRYELTARTSRHRQNEDSITPGRAPAGLARRILPGD